MMRRSTGSREKWLGRVSAVLILMLASAGCRTTGGPEQPEDVPKGQVSASDIRRSVTACGLLDSSVRVCQITSQWT